ncbi:MAG: helix-turn-helix domain-containing protein [Ruminococcus flavefaciens]|nr:helix-turn-helix domain-containing protein [Ruminococcus flavefaciens]
MSVVFLFFAACGLFFVGGHLESSEFEKLSRYASRELYERGEEAYRQGDHEKAAQLFMVLCSRCDESDGRELQYLYAQSFDKNGNIAYGAADYSEAMDFYLRAQRIAEKHGFDDLLGSIFGHIGNIYASNNDFESAVNFYGRGLAYAERFGNDRVKSMLTNNLVAANYYKGDMEAAERYFGEFKDLNYRDKRYEYDICLNRAILFNGRKMNDSAKLYAKKAIRYIEENGMSVLYIAGVNSSIAQFFEEEGQLDSALVYLHANEAIARRTPGADDLLLSALKDLARIYDKLQVRKKALDYKSEYLDFSDSVFNQKEFNSLKNKQVFYELERDASTIHRLNAVKTLQRSGLWVLSIAMAVFIALIAILCYQKRKLKAAWVELYDRNRRQLEEELGNRQRIQYLEKTIEELKAVSESGPLEPDEVPERKTVVQGEQRDKIASDIRRILESTEDYCASDYSIDKLAAAIGSNARYVSEVVNEVFGKNFRTLLNEYRIKKAMLRLGDTERYGKLTIKAIAESVGYKSQATFIAAFTKFTGLKPGIYQKLAIERQARA